MFTTQELEQERHNLKRSLENIEADHEGRCAELHADLDEARRRCAESESRRAQSDSDTAKLINELTQQNRRLADDLSQVYRKRNRFSVRRQHSAHLN